MGKGANQKMKQQLKTDFDVFNYVKQHLLTQNKKSWGKKHQNEDSDVFCAYRGDEGLSCAVGCLIDNDYYNFRLETKSVSDFAVQKAICQSIPNWEFNEYLLADLQYVHDIVNSERWANHLEILSMNFDANGSYLRKGEDE